MVDTKYKLLKLVKFGKFNQWDTKHFLSSSISSQFRVDNLGTHITRKNKKIKLFQYPEQSFNILGISNERGMFDAYSEFGKNIKQPYILVQNGYLAYNPYRVNVGSIGIKTETLKHDYISPAYVVFSCKKSILPEYLFLLMKTNTFNKIICENTTGSVRQTLSYNKLVDIKVPVPESIDMQRKLVENYNNTFDKAKLIEIEAIQLQNSLDKILIQELGIVDNDKSDLDGKLLKKISFSQCQRWSVDYLLNQHTLDFIHTSKFKLVPARYFIESCQYGLSEKASTEPQGIPMLRMNNIQNFEIDPQKLKYLPENTKRFSQYLLNKGDLLFNRTNSKELVGKTAIFSLEGQYVFASYLIRVVLMKERVDVDYVNILFASKIIRAQINLVSRQILGQANINAEEMKELLFPLPPLEIQKEIAYKIMGIKAKIKTLNQQIESTRQCAEVEFEKAVFGGDN